MQTSWSITIRNFTITKFSVLDVIRFWNLWYLLFVKNVYVIRLFVDDEVVGWSFIEEKPDLKRWGYGEYLVFLEMLNPQIAIHYTYVKKKYRNCGYGLLLRLKVLMTYDRVITGTNNKSSEYMLRINGKTNFIKIMERQSNCQWFFDKQRN